MPKFKTNVLFTFLYKLFVKQSIEWNLCQQLKGIFFFFFPFSDRKCEYLSVHLQDEKICHLQHDVNSFTAVCRQPILMFFLHSDFFASLVVVVIVITFSFAWSLCYFAQGMAVSAVTWDAQPILRPLSVLAWWHLHSADKPRFGCQPCKSQEFLKHVSYIIFLGSEKHVIAYMHSIQACKRFIFPSLPHMWHSSCVYVFES